MRELPFRAVAVLLLVLSAGCVATGPAVSKARDGNLQIEVVAPETVDVSQAEVYLDGVFVGNVSSTMPVIHARRGSRAVRVVAPGCKPYEKAITILGDPNHQILNVRLEGE